MHRTTFLLQQKAVKVAEEMIKTKKTIMPIPFRKAKNCFFLSKDIGEILALDIVVVDGETFFVGPKREK